MNDDNDDDDDNLIALKPHLPLEIIAHIIGFVPSHHLRKLFLVSRAFFGIAIEEWNGRLPPLHVKQVLHSTAIYHSSSTSKGWGKVNVFARVLKLGARAYSTQLAQVEFLAKITTSKETRSGGLASIKELPDIRHAVATSMGRKVWLYRPMEGGVKFKIQQNGFLIHNEPVARSQLHLREWNGEEQEVFLARGE
ncbi:hypothetical protein HDU97_006680 [Phlyctochytrium planicorne]|nr:hypothetical protein HDU97_006680 [Phlyctochytrium planicorne]